MRSDPRRSIVGEAIGAPLEVGAELPEGGDALTPQAVVFGAEIPLDFRMPRPMPARVECWL